MTTNHIHLFRRGAVYQWRRRLPPVMASILGRSHLSKSLQTADARLARTRARRLSVMFDSLTERLERLAMAEKRLPTKPDLDRILLDLFYEVLEVGEQNRLARPTGYCPWDIDGDADEEEQAIQAAWQPENEAEVWRGYAQVNEFDAIRPTVEAKLRKSGFAVPTMDDEFRLFLRKALATMAAAHTYDAERERGIYQPTVHPFVGPIGATPPSEVGEQDARRLLSDMFEEHVETKVKEGRWRTDSVEQARRALRLFIELKGDIRYAQMSKVDAKEFRTTLCELPDRSGRDIYKGLTAPEAIALRKKIVKALADSKTGDIRVEKHQLPRANAERLTETLTPKTVNKHLTFLHDFYESLKKGGLFGQQNPFEHAKFENQMVEKKAENRKLWTTADLKALFGSPLWVGCASARSRSTPGKQVFEDERFWIPLIGLFTGMRENEICGLGVNDISFDKEAGVHIFHVREGKTKNAKRSIPIHTELEKIGIIRYWREAKSAKVDRLFPNLRGNEDGDYASAFTKWFTRYRQHLGTYERFKDFHSLRHLFNTLLKRQKIGADDVVRSLMGHASQNEMSAIYFHDYEPKQTAEVLMQLDVCVDLSHLYAENQPHRIRFFMPSQGADVKKHSKI
jgi:integrase